MILSLPRIVLSSLCKAQINDKIFMVQQPNQIAYALWMKWKWAICYSMKDFHSIQSERLTSSAVYEMRNKNQSLLSANTCEHFLRSTRFSFIRMTNHREQVHNAEKPQDIMSFAIMLVVELTPVRSFSLMPICIFIRSSSFYWHHFFFWNDNNNIYHWVNSLN